MSRRRDAPIRLCLATTRRLWHSPVMEQLCNPMLARRLDNFLPVARPRRDRVADLLLTLHDLAETLPTRPKLWLRELDRADRLLLAEAAGEAGKALAEFARLVR